jgi:hypothetical protein
VVCPVDPEWFAFTTFQSVGNLKHTDFRIVTDCPNSDLSPRVDLPGSPSPCFPVKPTKTAKIFVGTYSPFPRF